MHIGILHTGHAPEILRDQHGDYGDMFRNLLSDHGLTLQDWDVENLQFPSDVHAADGWLITGSKHGSYEDHAFIPPLEDFIRQARDTRKPMVGICFGHQIMAQALGGHVEKFEGGWAVGPQEYDVEGQTLTMNAWHQDQVLSPPEGARCIAHNDFCRYAGFVYDDWGFSVQPHPEFSDAFVKGLIETRGRGLVPEPTLRHAASQLGTPLDADRMAARIADFLKQARG